MDGLIKQRDTADCGIAAIAMFCGKSYEETLKAGLESGGYVPKKGTYCAGKVLRELGFDQENLGGSYQHPDTRKFRKIAWFERYIASEFIRDLVWGRPCLLSVPSLNNAGGWHFIYYDGEKVLDPQNGRRGKKFYTSLEELSPREILMWSHA